MQRKPLILDLAAARRLCDQPGHDDRQRRAAHPRAPTPRVELAAPMGRRRLQPAVRRLGARRGQPQRPLRTQGHAAGRSGGVRPGQPRRAGSPTSSGSVDRRSLRDGSRRGDGVPVDAVAAHQRVHRARRARAGNRAVGRDHRARRSRSGRSSAAGCSRRSTGRASSSRWRRSPRWPACSWHGTCRPRAIRARRGSTATGSRSPRRRSALLVYTIIEAPELRLGQRADAGRVRADRRAGDRVRRLGAARRAPMLDLELFRNPRFTAASASVAISFFALSGFIFLITQYFQFLKGYGPLSTGVRLLPVASCVASPRSSAPSSPCASGTKLVVASGLLSMAAFYLWVTTDRQPPATGRSRRRWSCSASAWV